MPLRFRLSICVVLALCVVLPAAAAGPDGRAPVIIVHEKLHEWTFDSGLGGWGALNQCKASTAGGILKIVSSDNDPYLSAALRAAGPDLAIKLRARSTAAGMGQFFWATNRAGGFAEPRSEHFTMIHDGKWHEYTLPIRIAGTMTALRFDPGTAAGTVEIDWVRIHRGGPHPLQIERVETRNDRVVLHLRNTSSKAIVFEQSGKTYTLDGGKTLTITEMAPGKKPFERCTVTLTPKDLPPVRHTVVIFRPEIADESIFTTIGTGDLKVRVSRDGGLGARIERGGKLVAVMAPIVRLKAWPQGFGAPRKSDDTIQLRCQGTTASLRVKGDEIIFSADCTRDVEIEGPVLRAFGGLEQGLFAGLEYLGKGEKSSSTLDIETDAHDRIAPDTMLVTMPLMACVTDRGAVAMTWKDMTLRPVFASPNVLDGSADHRMGLRGKKITATILVKKATLTEMIGWAVKRAGGFPPLPKSPRTDKAQGDLAMRAINGPISGTGGWGHCAEARWKRHYFADIASTIWRITGKAPKTGPLIPGGAHVRNDAIFFVTGQADRWLQIRSGEVRGIISRQKPDGSFRYSGKYRRGHFEDTSSGHCARPAAVLLEWARMTGDPDARRAGLKALEFMKRFRTPRGAQTWELSLHTPDILASAYLIQAYVYGYELTGNKAYLDLARKWALSGVPFVYLWSNRPTMLYATIPVYGATNFRAPLWIGLPVQWCGGVYAYTLVDLAKHDKTLDWKRLAQGILIAGQQMQYPDGKLVGCLPDIFQLPGQRRAGPSINPCALYSLQLALAGTVDSLAVATDGKHRIVAPLPVTIANARARIQGRTGLTYQVVIDGSRIVTVKSQGIDELPLTGGS